MPATLSPAHHEAALRQLELRITRRLDGLLHGDHQGLVLAAGTDMGEAREYRVGDDVRRMDWNLTARTTVPHVRDTVAERELETWLVVDRSASMNFGTANCEKRDLAIGAMAAFAFLNNRAGNRTGAVLAGVDNKPAVIPARSGRDAVLALLHTVIDKAAPAPDGSGPGDLAAALAITDRLARRRGLVVVVSDFLDQGQWQPALRRLAGRHQVVAVEVRDPREDELPAVGLLTLVDPETGRRVEAQTNSAKLRTRFAEAAAAQRATTGRAVRSAGARHLVLSTDRDWFVDLVRAVDRWRAHR
jgi:uncharacterized protein (DUF58 family)